MGSPGITDGVAYLDGLKHLETLSLIGSSVGDDGMRKIAEHASLRRLYLSGWVTPKGLAELVRMTSLEELYVRRNLKDDDLLPIGKIERAVSDFNRLLS